MPGQRLQKEGSSWDLKAAWDHSEQGGSMWKVLGWGRALRRKDTQDKTSPATGQQGQGVEGVKALGRIKILPESKKKSLHRVEWGPPKTQVHLDLRM